MTHDVFVDRVDDGLYAIGRGDVSLDVVVACQHLQQRKAFLHHLSFLKKRKAKTCTTKLFTAVINAIV